MILLVVFILYSIVGNASRLEQREILEFPQDWAQNRAVWAAEMHLQFHHASTPRQRQFWHAIYDSINCAITDPMIFEIFSIKTHFSPDQLFQFARHTFSEKAWPSEFLKITCNNIIAHGLTRTWLLNHSDGIEIRELTQTYPTLFTKLMERKYQQSARKTPPLVQAHYTPNRQPQEKRSPQSILDALQTYILQRNYETFDPRSAAIINHCLANPQSPNINWANTYDEVLQREHQALQQTLGSHYDSNAPLSLHELNKKIAPLFLQPPHEAQQTYGVHQQAQQAYGQAPQPPAPVQYARAPQPQHPYPLEPATYIPQQPQAQWTPQKILQAFQMYIHNHGTFDPESKAIINHCFQQQATPNLDWAHAYHAVLHKEHQALQTLLGKQIYHEGPPESLETLSCRIIQLCPHGPEGTQQIPPAANLQYAQPLPPAYKDGTSAVHTPPQAAQCQYNEQTTQPPSLDDIRSELMTYPYNYEVIHPQAREAIQEAKLSFSDKLLPAYQKVCTLEIDALRQNFGVLFTQELEQKCHSLNAIGSIHLQLKSKQGARNPFTIKRTELANKLFASKAQGLRAKLLNIPDGDWNALEALEAEFANYRPNVRRPKPYRAHALEEKVEEVQPVYDEELAQAYPQIILEDDIPHMLNAGHSPDRIINFLKYSLPYLEEDLLYQHLDAHFVRWDQDLNQELRLDRVQEEAPALSEEHEAILKERFDLWSGATKLEDHPGFTGPDEESYNGVGLTKEEFVQKVQTVYKILYMHQQQGSFVEGLKVFTNHPFIINDILRKGDPGSRPDLQGHLTIAALKSGQKRLVDTKPLFGDMGINARDRSRTPAQALDGALRLMQMWLSVGKLHA